MADQPTHGTSRDDTRSKRSIFRSQILWLAGLGLVELTLYLYGARAQGRHRITTSYGTALVQAVPYALACWLVLRQRPSRATFVVAVGFAVGFRLVALVGTQPYLSTDVYRYVWDGRVQGAGVNPYRYPSSDPALYSLRDEMVYSKMNRPDARTIYPPGAEMFFFAVTRFGDHPLTMRCGIVLAEGLAVWAMCVLLAGFGLPLQRALLYLWHPLSVWEFAGSGHVDAVMIAFVLSALLAFRGRRYALAGAALAGAVLIKLFPVILFPAMYRRWNWRLPLALAVSLSMAYALYLGVGARFVFDFLLHGYAKEEGLDSGERFFALAFVNRVTGLHLPASVFQLCILGVLGALALRFILAPVRTPLDPLRRAATLAAAFTVLFSPGYAWYFTWLAAFLPFVPRPSLIWLTAVSFVLYANWLHTTLDAFFTIGCILYLPAACLAVGERVWRLPGDADAV